MYASIFWVILVGDPPLFSVGDTLDSMILTLFMLVKVKVPNE